MKALNVAEFKEAIKQEVSIVDTRNKSDFTQGFIPGAFFMGLDGRIADWAQAILPPGKPLILVTEAGKEEESKTKLTRAGHQVQGYLEGGYEAWAAAGERSDMIIDVEADELIMDIPHDPNLTIVDVRRETEFAEGHLADALNLPLDEMTDLVNIAAFEDKQNLYIHCAGGYRSVIAASLLKRQGLHNLRNVLGGWSSIKDQEKAKIVKDTSKLN